MRTLHWMPVVFPRVFEQVWFCVVLLVFLFSFSNFARAQNSNDDPKKKSEKGDSKEKEDERGGIIGDATRMLLDEHNARLLGNPHRFSILPIGYYDFRTGLNLGVFSRIESKQVNPYLYRLTLQVIASTKGSHKHKMILEYPQIGGSKFGFKLHGEWERDLEARYFGVGNGSENDDALTNPDSDGFIDEDFYIYNLKRPRVTLYATRKIVANVAVALGIGFESVEPQLKAAPETSFLAQDQPFGRLGGSTRHLGLRLFWDTRSDDVFPTKGLFAEFAFEPNFASVKADVLTPSGPQRRTHSVTFYRYTFSESHFLPVRSQRLIFANRVVFDAIAGDAPYYELGEIADGRYTDALGGSHSLRGFQSRRFQDKIKFFTLTELRYNFQRFEIFSHEFDLIFIGFLDNGRVWSRLSDIAVDNFHSTFGAGVWLNWNSKVILRFDVGRSLEQVIPYFRLYSAF